MPGFSRSLDFRGLATLAEPDRALDQPAAIRPDVMSASELAATINLYQIAPRHDAQNDRLPFSGYKVICAHGSRDRTEAVRETRWKSATRALIVLGCRTYPTHLRRPQDGWRALPAARRRSRLAKACHFCPSSIACAHRRSVSKGTYPRTERSRPQNGDCAHAGGERSTRSPRAILH
jgi:hypothetical protein